ncbi:restriction endonuclease subunit S [uncultured Rothia sp.]|uniref:restriction endonuclease subunit S n=1 Tax=uncultured Rothia sp. TaxID=316088 RepID=UPI0028DB85E3|nr:restriction endonuclease subunit S [uncultured Rothia sp.]
MSDAQQERIVKFLDTETAKIDHLIAKQRELITLTESRLKLWRERTFWGEVQTEDPFLNPPTGWKVLRNRHLLEHVDARSETGDEEMLSVSHITGVTPRSMKNVNMFEAESTVGYKLVAKNELVINTMWAWMGALGVSAYEGIVSPAYNVYRFRDLDAVNPMYFDCMYRTDAYVSLMKAHSRGIWESRLRLYPEVFLRLSSLVPPKDVQDRLVAENNERTTEAEKLITRCHKAIELLQERRSALITAAVTGQIEV